MTVRPGSHRFRCVARAAALAAIGVAAGAGCEPSSPPPPADGGGSVPLGLLEVRLPDPVTVGSPLRVTGSGVDPTQAPWLLVGPTDRDETVTLRPVATDGAVLDFEVDGALLDLAGEGLRRLAFQLRDGERQSEPLERDVTLRRRLSPRLEGVPGGTVRRNERVLLRGEGLLLEGEGEAFLRVQGTFRPSGGPLAGTDQPVDTRLPVTTVERFSRTEATVVLDSAIGESVQPGQFEGTATLQWRQRAGAEGSGTPQMVRWTFERPVLYALEPTAAPLERYVEIRGGGFVGGEDHPDEVTFLRIEGTFTEPGGSPAPFGPADIVPRFVDGERLLAAMRAEARGDQLVSELFGAPEGVFEGRMTPVTVKGTEEVTGDPIAGRFELLPVVQVLHVRFLPGFEQSLERFGLRAARERIEQLVAERIRSIYAGWRIEVRLQEPTDYTPNGYAILEVGGPDPNGLGLFGYDNTPGKDVGNLRLADRIGGANAETQQGGYPGYGGVFIENYLYFSRRPGLPGGRPSGAPDPDPLFDEIFDPVRRDPVRLDEVEGLGADAARLDAVSAAVEALANMVGETAAHEFGHSLGLANPYGSATSYHNFGDGPGCLMDSGSARPFGERAGLEGFERTRLCGENADYLDEILGG